MCLSSVSKKISKPTLAVQDGWKKFNGGSFLSKKLEFEVCTYKGGKDVPLDQWIKAEGPEIESSAWDKKKYAAHFHIWLDEKDAPTGVRRVFFRKAHTIGLQDAHKVIVAEEMYVPSDPNKWPPMETKLAKADKLIDLSLIINEMSSLVDKLKQVQGTV
jgi:hypothetical protein